MTAPKNQSSDVSSLPESVLNVYRQTNTELYQAGTIHEAFTAATYLCMSAALRKVGFLDVLLRSPAECTRRPPCCIHAHLRRLATNLHGSSGPRGIWQICFAWHSQGMPSSPMRMLSFMLYTMRRTCKLGFCIP
jgi:hypothetical protein